TRTGLESDRSSSRKSLKCINPGSHGSVHIVLAVLHDPVACVGPCVDLRFGVREPRAHTVGLGRIAAEMIKRQRQALAEFRAGLADAYLIRSYKQGAK